MHIHSIYQEDITSFPTEHTSFTTWYRLQTNATASCVLRPAPMVLSLFHLYASSESRGVQCHTIRCSGDDEVIGEPECNEKVTLEDVFCSFLITLWY